MKKGYKITSIKKHQKENKFTLNVYDINDKKSYKLYFKRTFDTDIKLEKYILENDTLFIYDVIRLTHRSMTNQSQYKESNIPDELNNPLFYEKLCKRDGRFLFYVIDAFKTEKMCKDAVANDPMAIAHVPERFYSGKLFSMAVQGNGICLQYIPKEMRDLALCNIALNNNPLALRYIPDILLTIDMCKSAVTREMSAINYVPDHFLLEVYQECIVNLGRLLPFDKKDYHYRDYKKIVQKIKKLISSTTNVSAAINPIHIDSIEDIPAYQEQLNLTEELLLNQLENIRVKRMILTNKK